ALAETGVAADDAVMIGDTTFDIEMARAAGVRGIGVRWGYHEAEQLAAAGAARLVADFAALEAVLDELLGQA
ncbi:MAG: HAD hydrolase-like protein, partial [Phaeovulum sp.]